MEMHEGRPAVPEGKRRAAKPIFGKGKILRALGGGAKRMEVLERRRGLAQEAERDPPRQELGLDISIA